MDDVPPARARRRAGDLLLPWMSVVAALALWELLSRTEVLAPGAVPPATHVLSTLWGEIGTRELWVAIGRTLEGWALGLSIAALLAIPLGVVVGSNRLLYRSVRMIVELLRPVPSVALIPLAILTYGNGLGSKVSLAAFACFWVLLLQTVYGVQDVDPVATDTARALGVSPAGRLLRVTVPSATPYIATGLRVASSVALILAVSTELVIGSPGLGRSINLARSGADVELMYALIVVTGALGWVLNAGFARIERRTLRWHPSQRPA